MKNKIFAFVFALSITGMVVFFHEISIVDSLVSNLKLAERQIFGLKNENTAIASKAISPVVLPEENITVSKASACNKYLFVAKWGSYGSEEMQFNNPSAVATDNFSNIYVADLENYRIVKFNSDGNYLTKWGTKGTGREQFKSIFGIATDNAGNVYTVDAESNRVQKFSSKGAFILQWGNYGSGDGQFWSPSGIAIDSKNNVYIADTNNNRIQKFSSDGKLISILGTSGSKEAEFNYPAGVAIDVNDNLYVADTFNNRIQKFSSNGDFILQWGSNGKGNSQFAYPQKLSVDRVGNVYVADTDNSRIQKFSADGVYLAQLVIKTVNGKLISATDVSVDSSGSMFIADNKNNRIVKFSPACGRIIVNEDNQSNNTHIFNYNSNIIGYPTNFNLGDKVSILSSPNISDTKGFSLFVTNNDEAYTISVDQSVVNLKSIDCEDPSGDTKVSVSNRTASIKISNNETVSCTFLHEN